MLGMETSLILAKPSFCSDPTPNNVETEERNKYLTRSLDTGGWR